MKQFATRLERHRNELSSLYLDLYHGNEAALQDLLARLEQYSDQRSEDLQLMDQKREENPRWYAQRNMLGMCLYIGAWAKTIDGVRGKLDYLEECGVNYLHLMPFLESPKGKSDGGYAVADFAKVQPELGTIEDLERLTTACRKRGISVCMDFVMNHTSDEHEWAKRARAGEQEYQDRYFFFPDRTMPDQYERTIPEVFPTTAPGSFTWLDDAQKWVMTNFYPFQ